MFDINLPATGNPGIECRTGGANSAHTLVFTFASNLSFAGGATVSQGSATVAPASVGPNLNQVTVELSNVVSPQHLVVQLSGAQDAAHSTIAPISARMDVLLGDSTASGAVNASDVSQTKAQSGAPLTISNFPPMLPLTAR